MKIQFYLNCNDSTGLGHFSRCLCLARHITLISPESTIGFAGELNPFAISILESHSFNVMSGDIRTNFKFEQNVSSVDIAIFDSYHFNQNDIDWIIEHYKKVIFIDDFCTLNFTGAYGVINFTINAEEEYKYGSLYEFLGTSHYINKPEMDSIRRSKLRHDLRKILVFFSGKKIMDEHIKFLNILDDSLRNKVIKVIAFPPERPLVSYPKNTIEVISPKLDIETEYHWADCVISGGGLVKYETSFIGIPNLSIDSTEEQHVDSLKLHKLNLTYSLGCLKYISDDSFVIKLQEKLNYFFNFPDAQRLQFTEQKKRFKTNSGYDVARKIIHG